MAFEVQKITQSAFDRYWAPSVRQVLSRYLASLEKWTLEIDEKDFYWTINPELGASIIWVHMMDKSDENNSYVYATSDGEFALIRQESQYSYRFIVMSRQLHENFELIQPLIADALQTGGEFCDGERDSDGAITFPVRHAAFIDDTVETIE